MPEIPGTDDVSNEAKGSLADGAVYGLGTTLGQATFGGIGYGIGGVVAGASVGGQKGETLSTLAVSEAIRRTMLSGMMQSGDSRGVK